MKKYFENRPVGLLNAVVCLFMSVLALPAWGASKNLPLYTNTNQLITVNASQPEFMIQLKSNPTTGYSWFLTFYNANYIKLIKHQYVHPDTKLVGAGGVEEWTFRLTDRAFVIPRKLRLQFIYVRPWETKTVTKTTVFHVIVT